MSYKVNFIGRLGSDAEVISNNNSTPFISCRVAVDDSVNKEKTTRWVNITLDNTKYKNLVQYLTKGKLVFVTGSERVSGYKTKTGDVGVDTRVFADSIEFVSTGIKQNTQEETENDDKNKKMSTGGLKSSKKVEEVNISINDDDDLPF